MVYKTHGIIIKRSNINDVDRLLTVYTEDFGKLLVKAKSVRKNQSKLKGHLELFLLVHLMLAPARRTGGPGQGFDVVTGAETIENFSSLHNDLSCLTAAYHLSNLTDKLIIGPEKDGNIWRLLFSSFKELDRGMEIKQVVSNFEKNILERLGYGEQKEPVRFIESLISQRVL